MSVTVTFYTPKDIAKSVKNRVVKTANLAELTVLSGVKRVAHAVSDKADNLNEKIDEHAIKKFCS